MITFEYSTKIIDSVLSELEHAEKYIRIAMFQIHRDDVFELLERKLKQGVKIEVFTLPHESVKPKIFESVKKNFEKIEKLGAKTYLCWWNVGSPLRTSTNVYQDSWFSFHGKFVVRYRLQTKGKLGSVHGITRVNCSNLKYMPWYFTH